MDTKTITITELSDLLNNNEQLIDIAKSYIQDLENIELVINDNVKDMFIIKSKDKQYLKHIEMDNIKLSIYDFRNYILIIEQDKNINIIISI